MPAIRVSDASSRSRLAVIVSASTARFVGGSSLDRLMLAGPRVHGGEHIARTRRRDC